MAGSIATQVYNGNTNNSGLTITNQFSGSSFLYINSGAFPDEYEIDCHLQLELGFDIKRVPLPERFFRTNNIITIPQEYRSCGIPMRLAMVTDEQVFITVYAVECYCCGKEELEEITNKVNDLQFKATVNDVKSSLILTNQLLQDFALSALATTLGGSLSVITGGTSLAIPGSVLPILAPAQVYLPLAGVLTGFP